MLDLVYSKRLVNFTKIFPIIGSVISLATPYKLEIYEWTCINRFLFYPTSFTSPLTLLTLLVIVIVSFTVFKKEKTYYSELLMLICSILGLPSIYLSNIGQPLLLCGPFQSIFLPSLYLLVLTYTIMFTLSIYLLNKKIKFLNEIPKQNNNSA